MTFAIDPDKEGALLWQYRAGEGSIWGGIQWGAAVDGDRAYFPVSDIRTPKPGGLHAVKPGDRRARVVRAAAAAQVRDAAPAAAPR